jgi:hypothetical protein
MKTYKEFVLMINEAVRMTHSNGKFTFHSDENPGKNPFKEPGLKEPGKGRFSHMPDRWGSKKKKDWKKTGKDIKNRIVKKFKDFQGIR